MKIRRVARRASPSFLLSLSLSLSLSLVFQFRVIETKEKRKSGTLEPAAVDRFLAMPEARRDRLFLFPPETLSLFEHAPISLGLF